MAKQKENTECEDRIKLEILVDCYGPEEHAMGWYSYLEEIILFPCVVECSAWRAISPLQVGDEVELLGIAPENECQREMFAMIPWGKRELAVPLSQLKPVHGTAETTEALEDWIYWDERGYEF